MATLSLNDEEHEVLTDVLNQDLRELANEINHTDDHAFKMRLQERERLIRSVATRLAGC